MTGYIKLDTIGHPISSQAKFTQTFRRVNFGTIEHTFTVDDPKTYTEPFTIYNTWPLEPLTIRMLGILLYGGEPGESYYRLDHTMDTA